MFIFNILTNSNCGTCYTPKIYTISPFINTYLNIPDSKGKESLFEAEMRRSLEFLNILKKLDKNKFSFVIMDEIFSSTNPDEGISGAYAIANNMSKYLNNMCMITTHYSYLSKLEKTGKFRNYKIPIKRDNENNIVYTYKLEPGISNQYIALELLKKKGFDKNIVDDALTICKKINDDNNKIVRLPRKRKVQKSIKEKRKGKGK